MNTKTYTRTDIELDTSETNALADAKEVISNILWIFEEHNTNNINCNSIDGVSTYTKEDLNKLEEMLDTLQYAEEIY